MRKLSVLEASALLIGTQIGAGVLGLPYALKDAGIFGILLIVGVGSLTLVTAIVVLKLSKNIDGSISEIARFCLGKFGEIVMFLSVSVLIYGALIAYVASSGELLRDLFGLDPFVSSIAFWGIFSLVVLLGLKLSGEIELGLNFILLSALIVGVLMVSKKFSWENLSGFDPKVLLSGTGVVAFAYVSHMLVPEILRGIGEYSKAKRAVLYGFFIPMIFYSIFVLGFVGAYGEKTPEIVTTVLVSRGIFGKIIGALLPLTAMGTSFIGVCIAQMRNIEGVFKLDKFSSWMLSVAPPLIIFLFGMRSFVKALWMGGTFGGILYAGILPVLMYFKCCEERNRFMDITVPLSGVLFFMVLFGSVLDLLK